MTSDAVIYDLTLPNRPRGSATIITLTEPFSQTLRVKANSTDSAQATRLTLIRHMEPSHSVLTAWCWADTGMPAKIIYSADDPYLGPTWNQLIWTPERIQQSTHNNPGGDRQRSMQTAHDSTSEDLLLLIASRAAWPRLRLGQTYSTSLLSSAGRTLNPDWTKVEMSLAKDRETVAVPGGSFRVYAFRAKWPGGRTLRIDVEADPPNRIIRWIDSEGERGELTGRQPGR